MERPSKGSRSRRTVTSAPPLLHGKSRSSEHEWVGAPIETHGKKEYYDAVMIDGQKVHVERLLKLPALANGTHTRRYAWEAMCASSRTIAFELHA